MSAKRSPLDSFPRRGLRREQAAAYVGVSASKFNELVAEGRMPRPFQIDACVMWDVHDLDAAFDELKYGATAPPKAVMRLDRI